VINCGSCKPQEIATSKIEFSATVENMTAAMEMLRAFFSTAQMIHSVLRRKGKSDVRAKKEDIDIRHQRGSELIQRHLQ
jgi:hypothetical protein